MALLSLLTEKPADGKFRLNTSTSGLVCEWMLYRKNYKI
jgi:hypothetical protein